jgi:hypothetical protein
LLRPSVPIATRTGPKVGKRARLRAIAGRCPVYMMLTHEIKIRTRLVD